VSDLSDKTLIDAIYHDPLATIRALLEAGADAKAPVDDGFPPLIAALSCGRAVPGATARRDVDDRRRRRSGCPLRSRIPIRSRGSRTTGRRW
jgi:hypothetical protein